MRWLNAERAPRMGELAAAGPVLVHFLDYAQLNCVRALPYVLEWRERYAEAGLGVLGVHSPRFPFTARRPSLDAGLERLGVSHPVADDSDYAIWHDYGCRGWPSLFLWGRAGVLRWVHFGEGEYASTEAAIQEELRQLEPELALPEPVAPFRPSDAPHARVVPPTEEAFPGGSPSQPWRPGAKTDAVELEYAAGGAHVAVDGEGELAVSLDGESGRAIPVPAPGLYELAEHPRHERHGLRLAPSGELALYSVAFAAGVP